MTGCCSKNVALAGIVTAVFIWLFDFLLHGIALADMYISTASMWRPEEQMADMMWICIPVKLLLGFVVAGGYFCWRSKVDMGGQSPVRKSMGFGLWVGLLIGVPQIMSYVWMPFESPDLPILWMVSEIAKWTLAGAVLTLVYRAPETK